jgi:hypothetical protein
MIAPTLKNVVRLRITLLALLVPIVLAAQAPPVDRVAAWREDLAYFAREFPARQKDFDTLYPRAVWDGSLRAIAGNVATANDSEIVLALMKLVATAQVGHTYVRLPTAGPLAFHRLPIGVQWFSDGLAVTAATEDYRHVLGRRIIAIGRLSPAQMESAVAPYIASEHPAWLRVQSQSFMIAAEVLRAVGQLDADGRVSLTLTGDNGTTTETVRLTPVPWPNVPPMIGVLAARNIPPGPARIDPNRHYRYEMLPSAQALYVRYNRCADDPQQPFAAFVQDMFAVADRADPPLDRVIVDVRNNGGGDSRIIKPLLDGLRARKALSAPGRLYVLIGPSTFSSALMNALDLKQMGAILVGDEPGEKLRSYGEVRPLTLPHTGVFVQYSTKHFTLGDTDTLKPDIQVGRSIAETLAGSDPVLERALKR